MEAFGGVSGFEFREGVGSAGARLNFGGYSVIGVAFLGYGFFSRGVSAGPAMTSPVHLNLDPWQGQSQVVSALFQ